MSRKGLRRIDSLKHAVLDRGVSRSIVARTRRHVVSKGTVRCVSRGGSISDGTLGQVSGIPSTAEFDLLGRLSSNILARAKPQCCCRKSRRVRKQNVVARGDRGRQHEIQTRGNQGNRSQNPVYVRDRLFSMIHLTAARPHARIVIRRLVGYIRCREAESTVFADGRLGNASQADDSAPMHPIS